MSIFYYFLQSIPECVGVITLSLVLARVPILWKRILVSAVIFSSVTYIVRSLPLIFGMHLPIFILLLFLAIFVFTNVKPANIIVAVFATMMILALLEFVFSSTFFAVTQLSPQRLDTYEGLWAALGVAQSMVLVIIALFLPKYFRPVEEAWKK